MVIDSYFLKKEHLLPKNLIIYFKEIFVEN